MDLKDRTQSNRLTRHCEGEGRIPAMRIITENRRLAKALGSVQYFVPIEANPFHVLTLAQAWAAGHELSELPPLPPSGRHTKEYLKAVA